MSRVAVISLTIVLSAVAVILHGWGAAAQSTPVSAVTGDEAAVRAVLEAQLTAWAAGDGAAYGATLADDADLITFDGSHAVGRQEIATFMQAQFDGVLAGTHVIAEPVRLRFLDDDTVVMITVGGVVFSDETEVPAERQSIQTFVLSKHDGKWLVEAFQNTRIMPSQP